MPLLAPTYVQAPAATPYRYGLASVLAFAADVPHWEMGVEWRSPTCSQVGVTTEECIVGGAAPADKTPLACGSVQSAGPFTVYAYDTDPTAGQTAAEAEAWARAVLDAGEWAAVEQHVAAALDAAVTAGGAGATLGAGLTPAEGLGLLENYLAVHYGGTGVIHTSRRAATVLYADGALRLEGSRLVSALGTPVAAYAAADAKGAALTMYATGALVGYRGDVDFIEALNRPKNRWSLLAERTYLVGWDCFAVKATAPVVPATATTP